jgi:hypothetical protein
MRQTPGKTVSHTDTPAVVGEQRRPAPYAAYDLLARRLARMVRWQNRGLFAFGLFFVVSCFAQASALCGPAAAPVTACLLVASAAASLPTFVLWLTLSGFIFHTAKTAFGVGSALVYVLLHLALWPWPGMFAIPHMLRLDIQRLRGVEAIEVGPR